MTCVHSDAQGVSVPSRTEAATVADILAAAAEIVAKPGAWTIGEAARDANGNNVSSADPLAVCWCAMGAINRASDGSGVSRFDAYVPLQNIVGPDIADWNDAPERTQAEVVAALREAARKASEQARLIPTEKTDKTGLVLEQKS